MEPLASVSRAKPDRRRRNAVMTRLWNDAERAYRLKILEALPHDASVRLLDIGCEDGRWTDRVRDRIGIPHSRVTAIEIVPEDSDRARARGFEVHVADLNESWPVPTRPSTSSTRTR